MGGRPLLALSVTAFPEELPVEMLGEILAGAADATREAGAILAGGHTIRDDEPKYGLAVVGTVHPDGVWLKSGARPGDVVFLTKPLGTGLVLQAVRDGRRADGALEAAVEAMTQLNRDAADALRPFAPNAVTDVTGFGLLGHAHETAERSGVHIALDANALPALPGALELAAAGVRTGGDRRNREFAGPHVSSTAPVELEALAYDPQTAGGLLVTLPSDKRAVLEATFAGQGLELHAGRPCRGRDRRVARRIVSLRARLRGPVSPTGFVRIAAGSVAVLGLVVMSGAFVRLTGSGLGCDNWPRCGDTPFPAKDFHAMVEFGNRLVALCGILFALATWLASRRVPGLSRSVRLAALGAFAGTVAQIPLGGLTVILDLHPLAVMSHFLLALAVVALAVVVALEAWSNARGLALPIAPRWLRIVAVVGVVSCAVMVVTGAVATASGPHPGADDAVDRLGLEIRDTVYVHVRATAVFGIGLLLVGWQLLRVRRAAPGARPPRARAARRAPGADAGR